MKPATEGHPPHGGGRILSMCENTYESKNNVSMTNKPANGEVPERVWNFVSLYVLQPIVWLISLPFVLLICVLEAFKKDGGV